MRFFKNLYRSALVAVAGVLALASCQPEESPLARAIMTSVSGLQFAATGAEPQTITVYSDADWTVEAPEWVTVDVVSGTRTMDVTVSVGDNLRDGALDNPKKDTIVFKGYNLLATAYVIVSQDGDKYRDVVPATISEVLSMKDEEVVVLDDVAVVALSSDGFVVNDGNESVFVLCTEPVTVGDCVDVWGSKGTMNGVPAVTICDDLKIERNFAVVYPLVNDITATIDTYAPSKLEYVELAGSLDGVNVLVEGATKVGALLAHSSVDLAALNGHNLIVRGFSFGTTTSLVNIIPVEIEDLGVNEIIYFTDNFDWLSELAVASGAGDSMGVDGDDNAKNAYTAVEGFADLLASQGYEDLFPSSKTIYLQTNYLKFSKNKNVNGLRLPAVNYGGTRSVVLTFDWGIHVGSGGQDDVELVIEIEGNGTADQTSFTHTAGEWEWQTETVTISGIDDNSRIVIKPTTFVGAASSGYYRWYLDNVKVVQGDGEAPTPGAGKTVFEDDFEWFADIAATEGAGDAVATNDPGTTAPNVYTMGSAEQFLAAFAEKGYKFYWGGVGSTEFVEGPDPEKGDSRVMYLQSNYLKFGKTSYNGAIALPALSAIEGTSDVTIEFDWCWQVTGAFKADIMTLSVDASVGQFPDSGSATSLELASAQSTTDGESAIEWQHVTLELSGATAETVLLIRPTYADPTVQNAERKQNRWYLDNIKVVTK